MRLWRKHNIAALVTQMQRNENALKAIEVDEAYVPSPHKMQSIAELRVNTKRVEAHLSDLEPKLWERIKKWQDTPYTNTEKLINKILSFIGLWLASFAGFDFTIMGWLTPLFAEPWHRFVASAAISLVFVIWIHGFSNE